MFTGLIEEVGRIQEVRNGRGTSRVVVSAAKIAHELKKGDSVAVSGVCLTAVEVGPKSFAADLAQETLARTSFSRLRKGALVNLELPMKSGVRLGGHVVQGHVDAVGKVLSLAKIKGKDDYWLRTTVPDNLTKYIVEKGSIAIEGISLTVAGMRDDEVSMAIIPHTYKATNLSSLKTGDSVNIEVDVLAKYAEKITKSAGQKSSIMLERLIEEGF
jgi:riboflavin synthase